MRRAPLDAVDVITLALDEPESRAAAGKVLAGVGRLPGRCVVASLDDAFPTIAQIDPEWGGALPTTLILDAKGRLVFAQHGLTRVDALDAALRRLAPASPRPR
jgi:hypothetical protein